MASRFAAGATIRWEPGLDACSSLLLITAGQVDYQNDAFRCLFEGHSGGEAATRSPGTSSLT